MNYTKLLGYQQPVTREAVIFADNASIGNFYKESVGIMQQAGIMMSRAHHMFAPKANMTRAEFSAILHRYSKLAVAPATAQGWTRNDDGQYSYYQNGKLLTGWQVIRDKRYYFTAIGTMTTSSWIELDHKWYYFQADGTLAVNTKIDNYEVNAEGVRKTQS